MDTEGAVLPRAHALRGWLTSTPLHDFSCFAFAEYSIFCLMSSMLRSYSEYWLLDGPVLASTASRCSHPLGTAAGMDGKHVLNGIGVERSLPRDSGTVQIASKSKEKMTMSHQARH